MIHQMNFFYDSSVGISSNLEVLCTHEIAFQQGFGKVLEGNVINGVNESTLKIDF